MRLNQINWPAELYANAALVTGDPELLRRDYRQHLRRFVRGVRHPLTKGGTTNLGRGYQFHYLPHYPGADPSEPGQRRVRVDDAARAARLRDGAGGGDAAAAGAATSRS